MEKPLMLSTCNCGYLKAMRMIMNCKLLLQKRAVGWVRSLK